MPRTWRGKDRKVTVTLTEGLVDDIDEIAEEVETTRSDIMQGLLEYAMEHVDDIFPPSEESEGSDDQTDS